MCEASAWQFGWTAVGSLGTFFASGVALWIAGKPQKEKLEQAKARQEAFACLVATELRNMLIGAKVLTTEGQDVHRFDNEQRFQLIEKQFNHRLTSEAFMTFTDLPALTAAQTGKVIAAVSQCQDFLSQLRNPLAKGGVSDELADKSMRTLGVVAYKETLALLKMLGIERNIDALLRTASATNRSVSNTPPGTPVSMSNK